MSTNPKDAIGLTKPALRLVPPALTLHVAQAMADGARKYGAYNWREHPVRLTVYLEAILRHVYSCLDGEDRTRDGVNCLHVASIAAGCAIILDALETGNLIDDRSKGGPAADIIEALTSKKAAPTASLGEAKLEPEPLVVTPPPALVVPSRMRPTAPYFMLDTDTSVDDEKIVIEVPYCGAV